MAQGTSVTLPYSSPLMKFAEPSETEPDGCRDNEQVRDHARDRRHSTGTTTAGNDAADQSSMKGHAAVPDRQGLERCGKIRAKVIEEQHSPAGPPR